MRSLKTMPDRDFQEITMDRHSLKQMVANAVAAERERCAKLVPTNWLDPLLTGKDAVVRVPLDCRGVEALLRGIQDRIRNHED